MIYAVCEKRTSCQADQWQVYRGPWGISISARIVQALGFPAVYVGGFISGAHLAVTEPLMTMTEQLDVACRVVNAVDLPVICDAGAGYGDPIHIMRTVRAYEDAGLGGMHLEDQVYPKRASYIRAWNISLLSTSSSRRCTTPFRPAVIRTSS